MKVAFICTKMEGGINMPKGGGVSGHTHSQEQLDHYSNQRNSNNDAYQAIKIIKQIKRIQIMMSIKKKMKISTGDYSLNRD